MHACMPGHVHRLWLRHLLTVCLRQTGELLWQAPKMYERAPGGGGLLDDVLDACCPVVPQVVGNAVSGSKLDLLKLLKAHALGREAVEQGHLDNLCTHSSRRWLYAQEGAKAEHARVCGWLVAQPACSWR